MFVAVSVTGSVQVTPAFPGAEFATDFVPRPEDIVKSSLKVYPCAPVMFAIDPEVIFIARSRSSGVIAVTTAAFMDGWLEVLLEP